VDIARTGGLFGMTLFVALSLAGTAQAHRDEPPGAAPHHIRRPHGMTPGDAGAGAGRPGWVLQNADVTRPDGGTPRIAYDDRPASPYMMNYTDEAAQKLGFKSGGGGNVITLHATPGGSVGLTMARGRPMLNMLWRLGALGAAGRNLRRQRLRRRVSSPAA
jgi:hypothetical protein